MMMQVKCGRYHSLAVSKQGEVYGWGVASALGMDSTHAQARLVLSVDDFDVNDPMDAEDSRRNPEQVWFQPAPTLIAGLPKSIVQV
jgi:alpha-tubulin suppressor-like RCC1 family protein